MAGRCLVAQPARSLGPAIAYSPPKTPSHLHTEHSPKVYP